MAGQAPVERLVEVAIDAAGASGARTYTYAVPARLAGPRGGRGGPRRIRPAPGARGDPRRGAPAGRRGQAQAGPRAGPGRRAAPAGPVARPRPLDRRPLPRPGGIRAPGDVAARDARTARAGGRDPARWRSEPAPGPRAFRLADRDLLEQLLAGPRAARDFAAPEGRAGLLRRLRSLSARGAIELDWTLTAAAAGPRYERWAVATGVGPAAEQRWPGGGRPSKRPSARPAPARAAGRADRGSGRDPGPGADRPPWHLGPRRPGPPRAGGGGGPRAAAPAAGPTRRRATRRAAGRLATDPGPRRRRSVSSALRSRRATRRRSCSTA